MSCNTPSWSTGACSGLNAGSGTRLSPTWRRRSGSTGTAGRLSRCWPRSIVKQGKPDQAIEQFTRAIHLKPDLAALYRARADVDLKRKEPTPSQRERALRDLDLAISHETTGNPVLALDQTNRAKLLHREGRENEALTACEAALKVDPNFLEAHRVRIDVLRKLKRHRDVISSCDALLTRGKPSAELYELRALAKQDLSDYQGAIEDDTLAIALRPGDAALRARRGGLFLITDAPRSALRDFDESIRLDHSSPDSVDAYLGRGLTRVTLGLHREAVGRRVASHPARRANPQEAVQRGSDLREGGHRGDRRCQKDGSRCRRPGLPLSGSGACSSCARP